MREKILARRAELEREAMQLTALTQDVVRKQAVWQARLREIRGGMLELEGLLNGEDDSGGAGVQVAASADREAEQPELGAPDNGEEAGGGSD